MSRGHPELEALAETLYVHYGVSSTPIIADDVVESGLFDVAPFIPSDFDGATDSRTWFPDHLTAAANVAVLAGDVATGPTAVQARRLVLGLRDLRPDRPTDFYRRARRVAPIGIGSGALLTLLQRLDDETMWSHAARVLHRSASTAWLDGQPRIGVRAAEHAFASLELSLVRTRTARDLVAGAAVDLAAGREPTTRWGALTELRGDGGLEAAVTTMLDDVCTRATRLLAQAHTTLAVPPVQWRRS